MNNKQKGSKKFIVRFPSKTAWNEFKDDLKVTFRENEIKFQYSEKSPSFYVLYKSQFIEIKVTWEDDALIFSLKGNKDISVDQIGICAEIFDLLQLFSGQLIEGSSPYEW